MSKRTREEDFRVAGTVLEVRYGGAEVDVTIRIPASEEHPMAVLVARGRSVFLSTPPHETDAKALAGRSATLAAKDTFY